MFLAVLRTEWKWTRALLVPAALLLFALPFVVLREITPEQRPVEVMVVLQGWSPLFPALAALLGLLVALAVWAPDRRGQHVHALTLPLARWRYVLLRYLGGATLLGPPLCFFVAGAIVATTLAGLPDGLQPYPWSIGARFALGTLLAYSLFFAILSGTPRTAGLILGMLILAVGVSVAAAIIVPAAGVGNDLFGAILSGPGPFALFTGRWMLVDV